MIRKAIQAAVTVMAFLLSNFPAPAAQSERIGGIEHARLLGTLHLQGELFHVQGVDLDSQNIWVTSVDVRRHRGYIHQFDRANGKFLRRLELTDGARYHPGGFSISDHSIWVPVAEYKPHSSTVLVEIAADTLQIRRKIHVADHLGCVAVSNHFLIAGNWDSKRLYIFDLSNGGQMRVVRNPTGTRYQDMKFIDGQLVAGGLLARHSGTIDWIDFPAMKLVRTLRTGATDRVEPHTRAKAYTGEGMTLRGRELHVLPEDGPSRLFHFRLDDNAHLAGNGLSPEVALASK